MRLCQKFDTASSFCYIAMCYAYYITTLYVEPSICTRYIPCGNTILPALMTVVWCNNIPHSE